MLIKTNMSQAIENFLNTDRVMNLNIFGIIENVPEIEIYVDDEENPKGVFVMRIGDYFNYIYSKDDNFIDEVMNQFFRDKDGFYGFSGVEASIAEMIQKKSQLTWETKSTTYYLPDGKLNSNPLKNIVQSIDIKDAEIVDKYYTYRNEGSLETIKRDISRRPSSAVYVDGEPVSWALIHDDGTMGIMYTREEYRGKGYALDVSIDLASKVIKGGRTPFLHIVKENNMSPGLARKCGLEMYGYNTWFGIIEGAPKELVECEQAIQKQFENSLDEAIKDSVLINPNEKESLYHFIVHNPQAVHELTGFSLEEIAVSDSNDEKEIGQIKHWCDVVCKGYEIDGNKAESFKQQLFNSVTKTNGYRLYIGHIDDQPVAAAALLDLDNETSGLHFLCTLQGKRHQGIGQNTVVEILKKARAREISLIMLQPHKKYSGLFKEIGFHSLTIAKTL